VKAVTAVDSAGNSLALEQGTPVYVSFGEDGMETSVRWKTRPFERRVTLQREALPAELSGFRLYHEGEFDRAMKVLASEAEGSADPLVRNWKWILAGHAQLLAEPGAYDAAVALYDRAAEPAGEEFAEYAAYFAARATLASGDFAAALARLERLRDATGGALDSNVLFSTYPQPNDQMAGWSVHLPNLDKAIPALKGLIKAMDARAGLPEDAGDAAMAEAMYVEAKAREDVFEALPEGFYDWPRPDDAVALLMETVEQFPETDAAERAYRDYVFTYQRTVDDADGDPEEERARLRQMFLEKFPASDLLEGEGL
jgi:hypothetical protein